MNPVLLQKQLRENSADLQDFCKDLKSWGEEMKRKEEALKKDATDLKSAPRPKVPKIDKSTSLKKKTSMKPATKIGLTDYAKWDKFDVEAACEKVDKDENDDSDLTDEFDETIRDEALVQKEKGNHLVKNQKWKEAITCYTKAIECYSYDPIFYANRALCYLKTQQMEKAEKDCSLSLKLDNTYVKAYQRRAAAREGLNKFEEAAADLLKVLEFEPKNKESHLALQKIKKKIGIGDQAVEDQRPVSKFTASRNKTTSQSSIVHSLKSLVPQEKSNKPSTLQSTECVSVWPKDDDIILVKAINKPPHLRSKKTLKRVEIVETIENISEISTTKEIDAVKKHVVEKVKSSEVDKDVTNLQKAVILENTLSDNKERSENVTKIIDEPSKITSAFRKTRTDCSPNNIEGETAWPKPNQQNNYIKSDDLSIIERKIPEENTKDIKNVSNLNLIQEPKKSGKNMEPPKTSVQFYSTWKQLKLSNERYEYLKIIQPQDIPGIFQESLEIKVFSEILEVLATQFINNKDAVYKILICFTKVKRFSAFTIFMDSTDRNRLLKLVTYIREEEQKSKEEIDTLIEMYEL